MMETIAAWFADVLSDIFNLIVALFGNMLEVDLATLSGAFPVLITGYRMFQSIGIGLIICIAAYQLLKFFGGSLVEMQDTPIRIMGRAFVAGMLLWFGGYIIELCVNLAALPYKSFLEIDANTTGTPGTLGIVLPGQEDFNIDSLFIGAAELFTAKSATVIIVYIILVGLIIWNVGKLMLEVLQRYLLVGVLSYTSPLFFSTITSASTANIFRSYVSTFVGQCALMGISAWMLKLVISGFAFDNNSQGTAFKLLLTLAMCKIAQRADTYMQTLGIGTVTTGAGLLDDIFAGGMALAHGFSRGSRSEAGTGEKAASSEGESGSSRPQSRSVVEKLAHNPVFHPVSTAAGLAGGVASQFSKPSAAGAGAAGAAAGEAAKAAAEGAGKGFGFNPDPKAFAQGYRKWQSAAANPLGNLGNKAIESGNQFIDDTLEQNEKAQAASAGENGEAGAAENAPGQMKTKAAKVAAYVRDVSRAMREGASETDAIAAGTDAEAAEETGNVAGRAAEAANHNQTVNNLQDMFGSWKKTGDTLDATARENGIDTEVDEKGRMKLVGKDPDKLGGFLAANVDSAMANKNMVNTYKNSLNDGETALSFLQRSDIDTHMMELDPNTGEFDRSTGRYNPDSFKDKQIVENFNVVGKHAMQNAFTSFKDDGSPAHNGFANIVGEEQAGNNITNFGTYDIKGANGAIERHVNFSTLDDDKNISKDYDLYQSSKPRNEGDRSVTAADGSTWYVHSSDQDMPAPTPTPAPEPPIPPSGGSKGPAPKNDSNMSNKPMPNANSASEYYSDEYEYGHYDSDDTIPPYNNKPPFLD